MSDIQTQMELQIVTHQVPMEHQMYLLTRNGPQLKMEQQKLLTHILREDREPLTMSLLHYGKILREL